MHRALAKPFLKELLYDLETISLLMDCDRHRETSIIVYQIIRNIKNFNAQASAASENFPFEMDAKTQKIYELFEDSFKTGQLPDKNILKSLGYITFIDQFNHHIHRSIRDFKEKTKPQLQKNLEVIIPIILILGFAIFILIRNHVSVSWGLREDVYVGSNFEKHIANTSSKTINFLNVGDMSADLPQTENISIRWQGFLLAPRDGNYIITVDVDDGTRVFIDGKVLIDEWKEECTTEYSNNMYLKKGPHQLSVDYNNVSGSGDIQLFWTPPGKSKEIIPSRFLRKNI